MKISHEEMREWASQDKMWGRKETVLQKENTHRARRDGKPKLTDHSRGGERQGQKGAGAGWGRLRKGGTDLKIASEIEPPGPED